MLHQKFLIFLEYEKKVHQVAEKNKESEFAVQNQSYNACKEDLLS